MADLTAVDVSRSADLPAEARQEPLVLVVDDDDAVRESLGALFASIGIDVAMFGSTADLLAHGLPDRPSCLVLDLRLPGGGGLDLQSRLADEGVKIPIIFLTGYADVSTSVRAMKAGAIDFIPKPHQPQQLLDAVEEALRFDARRRTDEAEMHDVRRLAEQLTPRERDVLRGVARGLLSKQIAFELGISEITVKMHRSSAGRKLKSLSVADMVRKIELLAL